MCSASVQCVSFSFLSKEPIMTISTDEVAKRLVFLRSNPSCARKAVYKREIISARAKHAPHALMTRVRL